MWTNLVKAIFAVCIVVVNGRILYYKVNTGQVFGPFEEEQVMTWFEDGYLPVNEVLVSNRPDGSFSPIQHSIFTNSPVDSAVKSRSFISKLSKKAGSVLNSQRKKLVSMSNTFTFHPPASHSHIKESQRLDDSTEPTDEVRTHSNSNIMEISTPDLPEMESVDISHAADASQNTDERIVDERDVIQDTVILEESELEMLAQIKRDSPTPVAPLAAPPEPVEVRKDERVSQKYSVRSLAKADYSLWDAEDVDAKKSAQIDSFLRDLDAAEPDQDAVMETRAASILSSINTKRLLKQLGVLVMEIVRFLCAIVSRVVPGPVQQSVVLVGALLSVRANHAVLLSLALLAVLSILRYVLYIALVPTVFALLHTVAGSSVVFNTVSKASATSASAGDIVTTVLDQATNSACSHHTLKEQLLQTIQINEFINFVRNLNGNSARHAARTGWQLLHNIKIPTVSRMDSTWRHAALSVREFVRKLASIDKEALAVVLVLAALAVVQGVALPLVEARLAASSYVATEQASSNAVSDEDEDGLSGPAASPKPDWVLHCESRLRRRVPATALVSYLRSASTAAVRPVVWVVLLAVVYPSLCAVGERARYLIVLPLLTSLALSVAELYLQPKGPTPRTTNSDAERASLHESQTSRLEYLCDVVSSEKQWAERSRWHLGAYILALLAHEQNRLRAIRSLSSDHISNDMELKPATASSAMFRLKVLLLSIYAWLQLRSTAAWTEFQSRQLDLARIFLDSLQSRPLLSQPFESVLRTAASMLGKAKAKNSAVVMIQHTTVTRLTNALLLVAVVLVLPSLLQNLQANTLANVRASACTLASQDRSNFATAVDAQLRLDRALLRSHTALTSASSREESGLQDTHGWSTEGPEPSSGIEVDDVTATVGGKVVLKNVSVRLPAGSISVIVDSSSVDLRAANTLLQLLWDATSRGAQSHSRSPQQQAGTISMQGRELREWNKPALRSRINFLSASEEALHIHAGALAGCLPGTTGTNLHAALRAQAASGALGVIAALAAGPSTLVRSVRSGADLEGDSREDLPVAELTEDQLKALHVSRALCFLDKPFVLLASPTDGMTEAQERLFFAYLREQLRPGQVVALTSARLATAAFADHVVLLDGHGAATERDNDAPRT